MIQHIDKPKNCDNRTVFTILNNGLKKLQEKQLYGSLWAGELVMTVR